MAGAAKLATMAILNFRPTDLFTSAGFGEMAVPSQNWRLAFTTKSNWQETLELSSGEHIEDVKLYVNIRALTEEVVTWLRDRGEGWRSAIGTAQYFAQIEGTLEGMPPSLIFEAYVPLDDLDRLHRLAAIGKMPTNIRLEVSGVDYNWRPDGSGKKWNTSNLPILPITDLSFGVPLFVSEETLERDPDVAEPPKPLIIVAPDLKAQLTEIKRSIQWTFAVMVVLVLALIFHRH